MKVCPSVAHPSHHNIGVYHPTVGRETEAHPSCRTDVHCKCDRAVRSAEVPVEHVRISIPVVEGRTKRVPGGEVTQNEGQQSQQTQQRPHRGGLTLVQKRRFECRKSVFIATQCKRARALYVNLRTQMNPPNSQLEDSVSFCIIYIMHDMIMHARCDHTRWVLKLLLLHITKRNPSKMETFPIIMP